MPVHTIRLRGWELASDGGRAVHVRRFGRPTNLGPDERVWLVGDLPPGSADASLNGTLLAAAAGPFAVDVTAALLPRNELRVAAGTPPPDARLEIRGSGPG